MSIFIGIVVALLSAATLTLVTFDRRTFYATVLIVSASYYLLFAVMASSMRAAMLESLIMTGFIMLAVVGFKTRWWVLALGLCAHGAFDLVHGRILANPGVPEWWPSFCMAYDFALALALLALHARVMPGLRLTHGTRA
jgi:hypothetical protein